MSEIIHLSLIEWRPCFTEVQLVCTWIRLDEVGICCCCHLESDSRTLKRFQKGRASHMLGEVRPPSGLEGT